MNAQRVKKLDEFQVDRKSWVAYRWQHEVPTLSSKELELDAESVDDEWAACCEFMLHPYDRRTESDGKFLLGTTSVTAPADMLQAYRFLSRVAAGQGGMVIETIGQIGTLRAQLVITCILRLIQLSRQHYNNNRIQHQPSESSGLELPTCGAADPFGIQCVCRQGTIAHKLAGIVGSTARPFIYLVKGESMDRCYEAMNQFFLPQISSLQSPMLSARQCGNIHDLSHAAEGTEAWAIGHILFDEVCNTMWPRLCRFDKGQFIVLVDRVQVAAALVPRRATKPDTSSWLWRQCRSLCTCVLDWQFPKPEDTNGRIAAKAVIQWTRRMRFATPGEVGLVSITTPGEVSHRQDLGHRRHLLDAIASLGNEDIGAGSTLTASLLRRRGFVTPYTPDVSISTEAESRPYDHPPSPAVTVEYILLQASSTINVLDRIVESIPKEKRKPGDGEVELALAKSILNGSEPPVLDSSLYTAFSGTSARVINVIELFPHMTPQQWLNKGMGLEPRTEFPLLEESVLDRSLYIQLLLRVIMDSIGGDCILVMANDEAIAYNITQYINAKAIDGVSAAIMLPSDWLATELSANTHLEAEIRMYEQSRNRNSKLVIVASAEAMDSSWLSMDYVDCCVVFGAPFSSLPLRSMVQVVCGGGRPRDVRIVHIGLAADYRQSLNGLMRVVCMDQRSLGLGINKE